jgi:protein tyrosine/serine phosphatase
MAEPMTDLQAAASMTTCLRLDRTLRITGLRLVALLALFGTYLGALRISGNFNTVLAGELYRSGQLSPPQIADYAKRYRIKSIINLRGNNTGNDWYDAEVAQSHHLEIAHIDFGMSARHELDGEQVAALISLISKAPKPLLIHCSAGADRSGLASALYLAAIKKSDAADRQLSIRFGHFSLPFIAEYAMDRTLERLKPSLRTSAPQD